MPLNQHQLQEGQAQEVKVEGTLPRVCKPSKTTISNTKDNIVNSILKLVSINIIVF